MRIQQNGTRRVRLLADTLRVETFEAGRTDASAMPPSITGHDSTCLCCDTRPDLCV
ncbi:MAG TPA: hypothetical protein VFQ39_17355 [Longimicrobium sp.]|nr:hypothetical protein [Longimicrobium sp.]